MRLLIDSSFWSPGIVALRWAGHDVEAVADWPADPGDRAILAYAYSQSRILVTLDKDFGDLIVRDGHPHVGLLRLVTDSVHLQAPMVIDAIDRYGADLIAGAIVTVEDDRIRVRSPD